MESLRGNWRSSSLELLFRAEDSPEKLPYAAEKSGLFLRCRSCGWRVGGRRGWWRGCRRIGLGRLGCMVGSAVCQRCSSLRSLAGLHYWARRRRSKRCQPLTLCQWKIVRPVRRRRATARLFLLINHLMQIAMLKHDPLAGLHSVCAPIKYAGDQHIRRIDSGVVYAGVAVRAKTHLDLRCAWAADEDAKIRRHQNVRVAPCGKARLNRAMIHGHHQAWDFAGWNAGVSRQLYGC